METTLIKLLENSPIAVALLFLVVVFVKYIKTRDDLNMKDRQIFLTALQKSRDDFSIILDKKDQSTKEIANKCDTTKVLKENSMVIGECTQELSRVSKIMDKIELKITRVT